MRHQKKRHKLGRSTSHRKATLAALGTALIRHKRITTTVPKAKALRVYIEPLITRAKEDTSHNRRQVFRRLQDNETVSELFTDVSAQVGDRPGGYTRVVKLGRRAGDGAAMAMIELVDYNDVQPEETGRSAKRTRRGRGKGRRRSRSKGTETPEAVASDTSTSSEDQDLAVGDSVDEIEAVESQPTESPASDEQDDEPRSDPPNVSDESVDEPTSETTTERADTANEPDDEASSTGESADDDKSK